MIGGKKCENMSDLSLNDGNESDSTDNVISSSEEEDRWREKKPSVDDLPPDYWSIQKLFRYVKSGNTISAMLSLCCIRDYDLTIQINQMAIRDCGGIHILVNLLDCSDIQCRICALRLLDLLSPNIDIRKYIVDLGIVPSLVLTLKQPAIDLKTVAANVIVNVSKLRVARKEFRDLGAIQILVDTLDIPIETIKKPLNKLSDNEIEHMKLVEAVINALTALFVSRRNREIGCRSGLIPITAKLLLCVHHDIIVAILRLCQCCSTDISFQLGIVTEEMVPVIVQHLTIPNAAVKETSAMVLMACADNRDIRNLVRNTGGVNYLVDALEEAITAANDRFIEATTGAIWKCAKSMDNVIVLSNRSALSALMDLLRNIGNARSKTMVNVIGAIAELLQLQSNRPSFRDARVLSIFVSNLTSANCNLLINTCKALEYYGEETFSGTELESLNAIRFMWSLLRHDCSEVRISAAHSLCSYIESSTNSSVIIRSFVGGFEIIIELLASKHIRVLAAVCRLISKVAKDIDNLAILTDYGVISILAQLIHTHDDLLREHLAAAIASCAPYALNTQLFGQKRIITPLVGFSSSNNWRVHRTMTMALEMLSTDIQNCLTMHQNGVAQFLLELIGCDDEITQKAATKCLANIRNMALDAENSAMNTIKFIR